MSDYVQEVYDFFMENAAECLSLVFKPVESTVEGKFGFHTVMRVYALEITVPQRKFGNIEANAWIPESDHVPPDHEYTANLNKSLHKGIGQLDYNDSRYGVPIVWGAKENSVKVQSAIEGISITEHLERRIPLEYFFIHQKYVFTNWQKLRKSIAKRAAKDLIQHQLIEDERNYY